MALRQLSIQFRDFIKGEDQLAGFCPLCRGLIRLSEMEIFYIPDRKEDFLGEVRKMKEDFESEKDKIIKDRLRRSRSSIMGDVIEHLSPFLPGFKYEPADLRHIGKPVDYLAFNGLGLNREVESVTFLDIKVGKSRLSEVEESIQKAVKDHKVGFETISFKPESLERGA
jgi:predicted Holliday junction resolvase-like endonuclease